MANLPSSPKGKAVVVGTALASTSAVLLFLQATAFYAIMDAFSTAILCGIFFLAGRFTAK